MAILELIDISRSFGSIKALSGISLRVEAGELRAVIGPNGAGKTTLFNLITGLLRPSDGLIKYHGSVINRERISQRIRNGIVRTFQITQIYPNLTVFDNVRIGVEAALGLTFRPVVSRAQRTSVEDRVRELLMLMSLEELADRITGTLSHGDQRVVEVAMTMAYQPQLLLLDEPTAGMGDRETEHMRELIRSLHRRGDMAILFIEHDMDIIFDVADSITVLDNGTLLADGIPDEIARNPKVQKAYLGDYNG